MGARTMTMEEANRIAQQHIAELGAKVARLEKLTKERARVERLENVRAAADGFVNAKCGNQSVTAYARLVSALKELQEGEQDG